MQIPENLGIKISNQNIERKEVVKFLGMYIDEKLDWHEHLNYIKNKLHSAIYAMKKTKHLLSTQHLTTLYYSLIYPYLDYGISLWGSTYTSYINKLNVLQKKAIRIITKVNYNEHTNPLFKSQKILKLNEIYKLKIAKYMFSFTKNTLPVPLSIIIICNSTIHTYNTRNVNNPHMYRTRTNIATKCLRHKGPDIWYKLPDELKLAKSQNIFTHRLKRYLLSNY